MAPDRFDDLAHAVETLRLEISTSVTGPISDDLPDQLAVQMDVSTLLGPLVDTVLALSDCVAALRAGLDGVA